MTKQQLIQWRARLVVFVRYSVYSAVGLGAFVAYLYVDKFTGYQTIMQGTLWLVAALVVICALAALALTVAAVHVMGIAGLTWAIRSPEEDNA